MALSLTASICFGICLLANLSKLDIKPIKIISIFGSPLIFVLLRYVIF